MTDISFWTQLNPNVAYKPTSKQFFNQYLGKLVIFCPAGRLINSNHTDFFYALKNRIEWSAHRNYNWGGSWRHSMTDNYYLNEAEVPQLDCLKRIKSEFKDSVKFRVEEPMVQIYTRDETHMREIVSRMSPQYHDRIREVHFPEDTNRAELLKDNKIILKPDSKINYKYKVVLRDGEYGIEAKQSMLAYLTNLGDEVKMTDYAREKFDRSHGYLWGMFVYVNDPSILTFLSIIHPNIVARIHEMVKDVE